MHETPAVNKNPDEKSLPFEELIYSVDDKDTEAPRQDSKFRTWTPFSTHITTTH